MNELGSLSLWLLSTAEASKGPIKTVYLYENQTLTNLNAISKHCHGTVCPGRRQNQNPLG